VGSHRGAFAFVLVAAWVLSPWWARAASVSQTGSNGGPGLPGAYPAVDETGGAGESILVSVTPPLPDLVHSATAVGGNGGRGGDGTLADAALGPYYDGIFSGYGGNGGAGGIANALAVTNAVSGDTSATSSATGGNGGAGGNLAGPYASNGAGGAGANGTATSNAATLVGAAMAGATANGGNGGIPGLIYPYYADPLEAPLPGAGGGAGSASASATASATTSATASAKAVGGVGGSGSNSSPTEDGGTAEAHAMATTSGSGDATANADAEAGGGSGFAGGSHGGTALATASAVSAGGNASASARQAAGYGAGGRLGGPRVSDGVIPGLPGTSSSMTDAVSGYAAGRLSLVQQAIAGDGSASANGGDGQSVLHATNPGGGELFAEVVAQSGSTAQGVYSGGIPLESSGRGGATDAEVFATVSNAKRVEAHAVAQNGAGFVDFYYGGSTGSGNATAHASAQGLGEVIARADANAPASQHTLSQADALSAGPVTGAHAVTTVAGYPPPPDVPPPYGPYIYSPVPRTVHTEATLRSSAGPGPPAPPAQGTRQASLFAVPNAVDVGAWTAGHPNTEAALTRGGAQALALGAFATDAEPVDDIHTQSAFELDLDGASFGANTKLGVAFLDSSALANSVDVLHLQMSIDGRGAFDTQFTDTATTLASLDDSVIDLGTLGIVAPLHKLVLTFDLDVPEVDAETAFNTSFAIFASTPEPTMLASISPLALVLVLGKAASRAA